VRVDVGNLEGPSTATAVLGELGLDGAIAVWAQRQKVRANAASGESMVAA
jgi:hypothetical protein